MGNPSDSGRQSPEVDGFRCVAKQLMILQLEKVVAYSKN